MLYDKVGEGRYEKPIDNVRRDTLQHLRLVPSHYGLTVMKRHNFYPVLSTQVNRQDV
jgi:hypothetical protein